MDKYQMAVDLITQCEGCKLQAYQDSKGIWTLGIGTIKFPDGSKVQQGDECTLEEAQGYLNDHLTKYVYPSVDKICTTSSGQETIPPRIYAALSSLAYNEGSSSLGGSIARAVYDRNWSELASGFRLYNKITINGVKQVSQGLVNRREIEIKYFMES